MHTAEPPKDISEYEALLSEYARENDALRYAIQHLNSLLCSDMGIDFQPDKAESIAIVQELAHTIQACLLRRNSKNN